MKLNGTVHYINKNIVVNNRHRILYFVLSVETSKFRCLLATKDSSQLLNLTALANSDLAPRKKKVDVLFHCMSFCLQFCNKLEKQKNLICHIKS